MMRIFSNLKNQTGTAAVEFALIGPIFFALLFSMIETGWLMTRMVMLDQAVAESSRLIYTGKAPTKEALETAICEEALVFSDCINNIHVEATTITDFGSLPDHAADCVDTKDSAYNPSTTYSSGSGSEIVFLRVCVTTDILIPGIGIGLSMPKTSTGRYQMVTSTAFMNEPF